MSIVSSEFSLASSRSYSRIETSSQTLQISVRDRGAPGESPPGQDRGVSDRVAISAEGRSRAAVDEINSKACDNCLETDMKEARRDPANQLLIALVEHMSGRSFRSFELDIPVSGESTDDPDKAPVAVESPPIQVTIREQTPAFSVEYTESHTLEEHETTSFSARGVIRTADDADIRFDLQLEMQRSYREESQTRIRMGAAQREDPLVINFSGNAAQLRDQRFDFDLNADGDLQSLPLLASGSGYLAFDRNGDGRVNNGSELFGALSGDGYADLQALDKDGNGWVDAGDTASEQLFLWLPEDGGDGKLLPLEEAGIAAISTANIATPFELRGQQNTDLGAVRATGLYLDTGNTVGTTQQIDMSV